MSRYRDLYISGKLLSLARSCGTVDELARRIGVAPRTLREWVLANPDIPRPSALIRGGGCIPWKQNSRDTDASFESNLQDDIRIDPSIIRNSDSSESTNDLGHIATDLGEWDEPTNPGSTQFEYDSTQSGLSHEGGHSLAPEGYHVQGVSTYYDENGVPVRQWIKTAKSKDSFDRLKRAMEAFAEPFAGIAEPAEAPTYCDEDLLCVYPFGDPHIGMYAWAAEAGDDFDLKIAERNTVAAVDALVSVAPPAKTAILVTVGDTFHADGKANTTTGGTPVDVDTRWPKVLDTVNRSFRRCIERCLTKHERVIVYIVGGNHDEVMSLVLAVCLAGFYENDPRVEVCTSPGTYHWHRFGKCLLGFAHGDKAKTADMPLIMACDRKEDWGETEHRQVYSGHLHHEIVKEYPGVTVRTLRTLAPKDKWHASKGYRSGQDMKCDVWHREWGQIMQHSIGIAQVRRRAA